MTSRFYQFLVYERADLFQNILIILGNFTITVFCVQGTMENGDPAVPPRVHGRLVTRLPGRRPTSPKVSGFKHQSRLWTYFKNRQNFS